MMGIFLSENSSFFTLATENAIALTLAALKEMPTAGDKSASVMCISQFQTFRVIHSAHKNDTQQSEMKQAPRGDRGITFAIRRFDILSNDRHSWSRYWG